MSTAPDGFADSPDAYYLAQGEGRYLPTRHVQGAWRADEQHMSAVGGLIAHAAQTQLPRPELAIARISYDILGVIGAGPSTVECTVVRPGRTIELIEARLTASVPGAQPRVAVVARVWRLLRSDTSEVAVVNEEPVAPAADAESWEGMSGWPGGFIRSLEFRAGDRRPGRGLVWLRSRVRLVDTEPVSELATVLSLVDSANGSMPVADPRAWLFPNTDLSVHLLRDPVGDWLGLDITASVGRAGAGITSAVLHDEIGPFGRSEQILTVRRLPG